jgi:hypothetical protein
MECDTNPIGEYEYPGINIELISTREFESINNDYMFIFYSSFSVGKYKRFL